MAKEQTEDNFFWVGIGASAGGLEAIKELVKNLPANANMVYIVAQHLSPKHKSMMTELVQRMTSLKVRTITDDCQVEPNTIYITPPQQDVSISGNLLKLSYAKEESIPKPSINHLFVALAEEKKDRSIGIILSGTGSDGAHGIKNIRTMGGITIAQDQETAHYDGMPLAAIQTDCVDLVLSPEQIGKHLTKISEQLPTKSRLVLEKAEIKDHFSELMHLIRSQCGVSFKDYKKATLQRRIERRMLANNIVDFEKYVDYVKQNKNEVTLLFKDILISVTDFFRDMPQFEELEKIIQKIVDSNHKSAPLRFWSVGCATGEEAYSLAILIAEALDDVKRLAEVNVQIFATDVDTNALAVARRGVYDHSSLVNVPERYLKKYFTKNKNSYEVIKPIKDLMLFASHNVIEDPPFLRMDLITCRNLLIYFEPALQKKIYQVFHYALKPKGYLFLGKSESISHAAQLYLPLDPKNKIFQRRAVSNQIRGHLSFSGSSKSLVRDAGSAHTDKMPVPNLHEGLIRQLGTAAVLIDDAFNIEHIYADATPFLSFANGKPILNLAEIINEVHKQEVRALVFKALREEGAVKGQPKKIKIDGKIYQSRLKIYPLNSASENERYLLVVFDKMEKSKRVFANNNTDDDGRIQELESELAAAREHLQTVIEELETSNEELQSLNEELQSSNEELQSSNEELETTNEELQSANEELVTMNDELNNKTVALEQTTNQLVNIKNSLDFPLIVINEDYEIIRSNVVARRVFELGDDKLNLENLTHSEKERQTLQEMVVGTLSDGGSRQLQLEEHGRHTWVHVSPFRQRDNSVSGVVIALMDNTDLMEQRKELLESRKKAQIANIAKTEFLANVSHEIRTPLNAIYGVAEILKLKLSDDLKRQTHLQVLENSAISLKELLDDLLDFAKLESGKLKLESVNFSLRALIEKVRDNYALQAERKMLDLKIDIPDSFHDVYLGDPLRVQQVLANLLSNAIKFTDSGSVVLKVWQEKDAENHIHLSVTDTGIGIKDSELEAIFEKFSQSDASISRRYGGTGLGLAIVRELIRAMDGEISVASKMGDGSTFTVRLPLVKSEFEEDTVESTQEISALFDSSETAKQNRLLIVDDQRSNVVVMASFLDQLGCVYDVAESGHDAIRLVSSTAYRCILLDLHMEGLDGFSAYEQIRDIEQKTQRKPAQVIAVSGNVQREVIEKTAQMGMREFLQKPVEFARLRSAIAEALETE